MAIGPATALSWTGMLLNTLGGLRDTWQGNQFANQLNQMAGEGREGLRTLSGEMREAALGKPEILGVPAKSGIKGPFGWQWSPDTPAVEGQAGTSGYVQDLRDQQSGISEGRHQEGYRQLADYAEQFFGLDPLSKEGVAPSNRTPRTINQVELGKGGLSGMAQTEGDAYLQTLYERENARYEDVVAELTTSQETLKSGLDALGVTLGSGYQDILDRSQSRVEQMIQRAD
ncbi:hypothetical protein LCGC14_2685900, partial [marine sediment metagenome]